MILSIHEQSLNGQLNNSSCRCPYSSRRNSLFGICRYTLTLMLAFVTGATGFVGSHVARALAANGADLRMLVREYSKTKNMAELKAELVYDDMRETASLGKVCAGRIGDNT